MYLKATQPDLGIENPYALDETQFQAAVDLLKAQKPLLAEYWGDYAAYEDNFRAGSSVLGTAWQVITNTLKADEPADSGRVRAPEGRFDGVGGQLDGAQRRGASELRVHVDQPHHVA